MAERDAPVSPPLGSPARARVCHLSRRRGWFDPGRPGRASAEVNLLAVYLGSPVWTLGTAWESVFRTLLPPQVERAYRKATARLALIEEEVDVLRALAERLSVPLEVHD